MPRGDGYNSILEKSVQRNPFSGNITNQNAQNADEPVKAEIEITYLEQLESLSESYSWASDLIAGIRHVQIGGEAGIESNEQRNSKSATYLIRIEVRDVCKVVNLDNFKLHKQAIDLLSKGEIEKFCAIFGDKYVYKTVTGKSCYVALRTNCDGQEKSREYKGSVEINAHGLAGVKNIFNFNTNAHREQKNIFFVSKTTSVNKAATLMPVALNIDEVIKKINEFCVADTVEGSIEKCDYTGYAPFLSRIASQEISEFRIDDNDNSEFRITPSLFSFGSKREDPKFPDLVDLYNDRIKTMNQIYRQLLSFRKSLDVYKGNFKFAPENAKNNDISIVERENDIHSSVKEILCDKLSELIINITDLKDRLGQRPLYDENHNQVLQAYNKIHSEFKKLEGKHVLRDMAGTFLIKKIYISPSDNKALKNQLIEPDSFYSASSLRFSYPQSKDKSKHQLLEEIAKNNINSHINGWWLSSWVEPLTFKIKTNIGMCKKSKKLLTGISKGTLYSVQDLQKEGNVAFQMDITKKCKKKESVLNKYVLNIYGVRLFNEWVGDETLREVTFCGQLIAHRAELFQDEQLSELY